MKSYVNNVYTPVYDFTIANLYRYQELQKICVSKLSIESNDKILCIGLGTGNEIIHLMKYNQCIDITGIDCCIKPLKRAQTKASKMNASIDLYCMDVLNLEFESDTFDKILCIHVMDFINDCALAASEVLRVLKPGGQFVITFPTKIEGLGLGIKLLRESIRHNINSGTHPLKVFTRALIQIVAIPLYLPLLLRPSKKSYSEKEVETIITGTANIDFQIEDYADYMDLIVSGRKKGNGEKYYA